MGGCETPRSVKYRPVYQILQRCVLASSNIRYKNVVFSRQLISRTNQFKSRNITIASTDEPIQKPKYHQSDAMEDSNLPKAMKGYRARESRLLIATSGSPADTSGPDIFIVLARATLLAHYSASYICKR